jgi:hypothetical protein
MALLRSTVANITGYWRAFTSHPTRLFEGFAAIFNGAMFADAARYGILFQCWTCQNVQRCGADYITLGPAACVVLIWRFRMPQIHSGGCLCGEVRFTTTGRPVQVLVCHCTMCQRATGSAFSIEPVFLKERVELQGSSLATYQHRSADHGRSLDFSFCRTCGNRIGLTLQRFPSVQVLYGGTFDDPSCLAPSSHIFTESAIPWLVLPSDTPCFKQHMFNTDGSAAQPIVANA